LKDGSKGKHVTVAPPNTKDVIISSADKNCKKIYVKGGDTCVTGIRLMDKQGSIILEAGNFKSGKEHNIELEDGERIVGIQSMLQDDNPDWFGLTFVFAKLE